MLKKELPHHHEEETEISRIQEQLSNIDNFQTVAEIFKQLGDTTRIQIFFLLCHCEECVINISALLDMSSPAVSHHLRPLRNSGRYDSQSRFTAVFKVYWGKLPKDYRNNCPLTQKNSKA